MLVPGDEDLFPPADGGVPHPIPPPPPRWMGMDGPNLNGDDSVGNSVSHSAHGPSGGGDVNMSDADNPEVAAQDAGDVNMPDPVVSLGNIVQGEEVLTDSSMIVPTIPPGFEQNVVVVKVNNLILSFTYLPRSIFSPSLLHIKYLLFNLDTLIACFIADHGILLYLASITYNPNEQAERELGFIGLEGEPYSESEEEDEEVVLILSLPPSSTSATA